MSGDGVKSFSSFHKRSANKNIIAGTRPSLSNNQLLISTGIPSLDNVLGESRHRWAFDVLCKSGSVNHITVII